MHNCDKGKKYEDAAITFLQKNHIKILDRNFRSRQGEIDIIGLNGSCLIFFEVKYRKSNRSGNPEEAVGEKKQEKICRTSDYYRMLHPQYQSLQIRYDVIAILDDEFRWYQNAFPYHPGGHTCFY